MHTKFIDTDFLSERYEIRDWYSTALKLWIRWHIGVVSCHIVAEYHKDQRCADRIKQELLLVHQCAAQTQPVNNFHQDTKHCKAKDHTEHKPCICIWSGRHCTKEKTWQKWKWQHDHGLNHRLRNAKCDWSACCLRRPFHEDQISCQTVQHCCYEQYAHIGGIICEKLLCLRHCRIGRTGKKLDYHRQRRKTPNTAVEYKIPSVFINFISTIKTRSH